MKTTIVRAIIAFACISIQSNLMSTYPDVNSQTHINNFLLTLASKTGARFTLELWIKDDGENGPSFTALDTSSITPEWNPKTAIENYFPIYEVTQVPGNANLYQIKDIRLAQVKNYALDKKIDSVAFTGALNDYMTYLGTKVATLSPSQWQQNPVPGNIFPNRNYPQVAISLTDKTAREAISACLDVAASSGICWQATTVVTGQTGKTTFSYTNLARFIPAP